METGAAVILAVAVFIIFILVFSLIDANEKLKEEKRKNQNPIPSHNIEPPPHLPPSPPSPHLPPSPPSPHLPTPPPPPIQKQTQETEKEIRITDEFEAVRNELMSGTPVIFVHGGAGVGKSTLIQWLSSQGLIHVKLAPTGLAALNIGGKTIHKFFSFSPQSIFAKGETHNISYKSKNVLEHAKTICIDEVSMVRSDLMDAIDFTLRNYAKNQKPFGGYQILMVGDLYQLPPVVNDNRLFRNFNNDCDLRHGWESQWCLDADVFKNVKIKRINLTTVFRQSDEAFVNILNDLRVYCGIEEHLRYLNDTLEHMETATPKIGDQSKTRVTLTLTNKVADDTNRRYLACNPNPEHQFQAIKTGVFTDPKMQRDLPVAPSITLKKDTFVMIVCNDKDGLYVNGSTGIIESFFPGSRFVKVKMKNRSVIVGLNTWEAHDLEWDNVLQRFKSVVSGTYTQIPIIPAYAITCHKAQGKTISDIFLDFPEKAFSPGQTYVALSRVRSMDGIAISRDLSPADFKMDDRLWEFQKKGLI